MLPVTMPHNDTIMLRGSQLGPYREHKYLKIIEDDLKDDKIPNDEEARVINRKIMYHKQKHLMDFFQRESFSFV